MIIVKDLEDLVVESEETGFSLHCKTCQQKGCQQLAQKQKIKKKKWENSVNTNNSNQQKYLEMNLFAYIVESCLGNLIVS